MSMNLIIQQKRRELGITQEQVAQYLGVSTPAVSKWEKGITCPDISLLPQLARLLKTDLNTLFCFHEELTAQEISDFCKALKTTNEEMGIQKAFEQAEDMVRSYPHNELLLQMVTMSLDGMLMFSNLTDDKVTTLNKTLESWYHRLADSVDPRTHNTAHFMLASRYIRAGDLEKAQETLDQMPDKNDIRFEYADKLMLQVNIYLKQNKPELATQELEKALLLAINKVQLLLTKLVDSEMAAREIEKAEHIAKVSQDMVKLFDLWEGSGYPAPLSVAMEQKDPERVLRLLNGMLSAALNPWYYCNSPLYHRIPGEAKYAMDNGMISGMLMELSRDPQYDFLRNDERFQNIIDRAKAMVSTVSTSK